MAYSKNRRLADIIADTDGNIVVTTQSASDNDTSAASTAYVTTAINNLIDSAPGTMNTLNEIAAAINDDADFNTTVNTAINLKAPLASPTFSGIVSLSNRAKTIDGSAQMNIGQWDGSNHRIEADSNRKFVITSYHTDGIHLGGSGASHMVIKGGKVLVGDTASHTDDLFQIETPASGGGHGIQIRRNDSNSDQGIGRVMFGNNTDTDLATIQATTDGATDNARLTFHTQPDSGSSTERMRINHDGNVGIGNDNPSDRLVVQKDSANIEPILVLKNDNTTDDNGISIDFSGKDTGGNNILYGRIAAKYTNHATEKSHMIFTHRNNSGSFAEWMRVTHDALVGIGEDSPDTILHLKQTNNSAGDLYTQVGSGNVPSLTIQNAGTTNNNNAGIFFKDNSGHRASVAARFVSHTSGDQKTQLRFSVTGAGSTREKMTLTEDGYLGIGTVSPNYMLQAHRSSSSSNYIQITNSDTGSGSGDGLIVGVASDEAATFWNYENTKMVFGTNGSERFRITNMGHFHGEVLSNSNSNPLGSGTNSGKLWSTSGNWINVYYIGNDPYGTRYFYEMDIQGLYGYTSYGEIYKDRNGRWHINKIRSSGTDIQVEGTNNYIQVNQNSGANQTNSAGNLTLVRAPGTT